ncbi:hypothetical protein TPDSL_19190 [Terrisporobacter petrolearius]|uniref:hypothetical protein n=1 Tax=Terrisporobacter petrolearius TaxID=1460447 RepID=UPI00336904CB
MNNKVNNNDIATKNLNSSQNYNKDKNVYFTYYIAGLIILAVFLNLAVKIDSTDEYYEKYYVLEEYMNNYEDIHDNQDTDNNEELDNSNENNEHTNEEENSHTDTYINEEY